MSNTPVDPTSKSVRLWDPPAVKLQNTQALNPLASANLVINTLGHWLYSTIIGQRWREFHLPTKNERTINPCSETWMRCLKNSIPEGFPPLRITTDHSIASVFLPISLNLDTLEIQLLDPSASYRSILRGDADIAIVLDHPAIGEGVLSTEIGQGFFQLYSLTPSEQPIPVLVPDDSTETRVLQHRWRQSYPYPLKIKNRFPNWSLIADVCLRSSEVGFLPDFLAINTPLIPVSWQPLPTAYRLLALRRKRNDKINDRLELLIRTWKQLFSK